MQIIINICIAATKILIPFLTTECQCLSEQNLVSVPLSVSFVFSFHADLVADLIFAPGDGGQGFGFSGADPKSLNSDYKKDCVYAAPRLSNGLVYLCGRSDRLYVNKPNALLLTEKQTGKEAR